MDFPFKVRLKRAEIVHLVNQALSEDIGKGDITTEAIVPGDLKAKAHLILKQDGVIAGLPVFETVFRTFDSKVLVKTRAADGRYYPAGKIIAVIEGRARSLLTCERVALNFIQRLSGIATLTRRYVEATRDTGVKIIDTRKTTPGLRMLEKYAVTMGGGANHRPTLADLVLIKDNHIKSAGGVSEAIARVRLQRGRMVEIELGPDFDLSHLKDLDVDIVMLDNWPLGKLRSAIRKIRALPKRPLIEVSGGMEIARVRKIAKLQPDFISVGRLTHSAPALDMSIDFT